MSIYTDIVTNELFAWIDDTTGDRLVDYVLTCRAAMLAARSAGAEDPLALLAAEIAYDRALIKLCGERGIEVDVAVFASPRNIRLFLEYQLYRAGMDLHALACRERS